MKKRGTGARPPVKEHRRVMQACIAAERLIALLDDLKEPDRLRWREVRKVFPVIAGEDEVVVPYSLRQAVGAARPENRASRRVGHRRIFVRDDRDLPATTLTTRAPTH